MDLKRDELARYGLSVDDADTIITNAIGGENVTNGNQRTGARYPVNVRYFRDNRSSISELERVSVPVMDGKQQVPLSEISDIRLAEGPSMLRNENGLLTGYSIRGRSGERHRRLPCRRRRQKWAHR